MEDDYPDTIIGELVVDERVPGRIDFPEDIDRFAVELEPGFSYEFVVIGEILSEGALTLVEPVFFLFDDTNGVPVTEGSIDPVVVEQTDFGAYVIEVFSAPTDLGTYEVLVTRIIQEPPIFQLDDYPAGTSGVLTVGGNTTGFIETRGDRDSFTVFLEEGRSYRFDVEGVTTNAGTLPDPFVEIYDPSGSLQIADDDSGSGLNASIAAFTPSVSGNFQVEASGLSGTGSYLVSATRVQSDDYPANSPGTLTVGGSQAGHIETPGDIDGFEVFLIAGRTYQFDVVGAEFFGAGPLLDPSISITDATNRLLGQDDDSGAGLNARINDFTPATTGTYVVYADSLKGFSGTYEISAVETTPQAPTDGPVTVNLSATDLMISEGEPIIFDITRTEGAESAFRIDYIILGDGTGFTTSDLTTPAQFSGSVRFTASGPDTQTVSISTRNDTFSEGVEGFEIAITQIAQVTSSVADIRTGIATISGEIDASDPVSPTPTPTPIIDDYPIGTNGLLSVGRSLAGNIERSGDSDTFAVTLVAGNTYQFDMRGVDTAAGTLVNPFLQLGDSVGTFLGSGTDLGIGLDDRITFTPTTSGEYFLYARVLDGTSTGTYQISATQTSTPTPPAPEVPTDPPNTDPTPVYVETIILLYEAALNRNGSYGWDGVNFWIDGFENGASYQAIARNFLNSPEFERKYGEPLNADQLNFISDSTFVNTMFFNVLGREGAPQGLEYWNGVLANGGNRESVLLNFARSPENIANNALTLESIYDAGDGYWLI